MSNGLQVAISRMRMSKILSIAPLPRCELVVG